MRVMMAKATQPTSESVSRGQIPETSVRDRTGFLLWHAMLEWRRKLSDALEEVGLTHFQFSLLASASYLNHRGPSPSQAELAEHTGTDMLMTSQVVRKLERERLMRRIADRKDARVKRVVPTAKSESIVCAAIRIVNDLSDEVFGPIEDIDRSKEALRLVADCDIDGRRTRTE